MARDKASSPKAKAPKKARKQKAGPERVPSAAEDIEHTIRRAIRQREIERSKKPGLYL